MDVYLAKLEKEEEDRVAKSTTNSTVASPLSDVYLLESIFCQLPLDALRSLSLVSRLFRDAALTEMLQEVSCHSPTSVSKFHELLLNNPSYGRKVKGFQITKASLPLLPTIPELTPNVSTLTLAASSSLEPSQLSCLLPRWPRLRTLVIIGQDSRSRRRRLIERTPESDLGEALATLAEQDGGIYLTTLEIMNTPLREETLERILKGLGEGLRSLTIDGCGIGHGIINGSVGRWCPALRDCRIDVLAPFVRPTPPAAGTQMPSLPPPMPITISLPLNLTSLHLSSLPARLAPDAFAIFSHPSRSSLRTVSFSHSPITPLHLSHFTQITRLKIVACPHVTFIPVFPLLGSGDGCKELRHLSLLGCRGMTLGNLWELAMLGRQEMGIEERNERKKLGLGERGLKKLTIDGADGREYVYSARGLFLSYPYPLPLLIPSLSPPDVSPLPAALAPPAYLLPHLATNVLDPSLPSHALLQTLIMALDLEEVAFFGSIPDHATSTPSETSSSWYQTRRPNDPPSFFHNFLGLGYIFTSIMSSLDLLQNHPTTASNSHPSDWPPVPVQQLVGKDGKPNQKRGRIAWPKKGSEAGKDSGRRLTVDEICWLLKASEGTGNLQRVSV